MIEKRLNAKDKLIKINEVGRDVVFDHKLLSQALISDIKAWDNSLWF